VAEDWWKAENIEGFGDVDMHNVPKLNDSQLLGLGSKMVTILSLLAFSINAGDKMLVFSQSIASLDMLEKFLGMKGWGEKVKVSPCHKFEVGGKDVNRGIEFSNWKNGNQYLRLDGTTSDRQRYMT